MSDPVANVQIEDVLSSIRRLVSEEGKSEARQEAVKPSPTADRLVLTPALRVAEPVDDTPSIDVPDVADAEIDVQSDEGDETAPWTDPDATLYGAAQDLGEAVEEYFPDEDDVELDEAPSAIVLDEQYEVAAEPVEEVSSEAEAGQYVFDPAEEGDLGDVTFDNDTSGNGAPADDEDTIAQTVEIEEEQVEIDLEPLTSKIEALEAVIAQTKDQWEPDGEGHDAYSGTRVTAMAWEDHAEAGETLDAEEIVEDVVDEVAPKVQARFEEAAVAQDATEGDDASVFASDEAVLDEESLRELVADIVREELQGALGERITRNVRKLVRREIHRALTAQELE